MAQTVRTGAGTAPNDQTALLARPPRGAGPG